MGGVVGGVSGGSVGGVLGGHHRWRAGFHLPPPPKAAPRALSSAATCRRPRCSRDGQPRLSAVAKTAHIQGTSYCTRSSTRTAPCQSLQDVSGPPLLVQAALDAVKQWRYQPTQLNGEPVEVDTTITVSLYAGRLSRVGRRPGPVRGTPAPIGVEISNGRIWLPRSIAANRKGANLWLRIC